jgi:hypothetical protein
MRRRAGWNSAAAALIPVAYTVGTDFRPAARHPLDSMVHLDRW